MLAAAREVDIAVELVLGQHWRGEQLQVAVQSNASGLVQRRDRSAATKAPRSGFQPLSKESNARIARTPAHPRSLRKEQHALSVL